MQTKRLITMLLVVVLTLVCGATVVAAQDETNGLFMVVEVESSATVAEGVCALNPGETVNVRVIISQKTEIGLGLQFNLGYDATALEPVFLDKETGSVDYTSGNLFGEFENVYAVQPYESGLIQYFAVLSDAKAVEVADNSVVMTMTFKVKDDYHGKTGLTFSDALTFSGYDQVDAVVTDSNTEGYIGATIWSHEFGAVVTTPATCTTPATVTCDCTVAGCGSEEFMIETAPALGHTPGAEATCTTAQTCTTCSAEMVPAKGHTLGAEATCTTAQICTVCSEEVVPAKGHTAGAEATCTTAQSCTVCEAVLVPAKGHTTEVVAGKAATCTEDGLTEGSKCTVCNEVVTEQTKISATGHTYGDWKVKTEAAGGKEGVEERACAVCGLAEQRAIPAAGLSTLAIVLIVVAVVVVLGGGFCLYWFVFRKKRSA